MMASGTTTLIPFKNLTSHCDHCDCTQIAKKAGKVIIKDVPQEILSVTILASGKDIKIIEDEGQIILYGGSSSLIMPCTHIGGKHILQVSRKKCGTVTVSRYNKNIMISSPDRSYRVHAGFM